MKFFGIEVGNEEGNRLMIEQSNGKELTVIDGKVIAEEHTPTQRDLDEQSYYTLVSWFDVEYARKEQKLRRLHTLGLTCDDGTKPYDSLVLLYQEAELKSKRIQELEKLINE